MAEPAPKTEELLQHVGFLRGLARSLVFDEGQADDVVQDALLVALKERPRHRSRLRAWLAGITRNLALKSLRSEGRRARRERAVARAESVSGTSEIAARLELHRLVVENVQALPEPYRTALVHRYFDGLTVPEVARLTGVNVKTAETRVRRAIQQLRERMDAACDGDRRLWSLGLITLVPFSRAVPAAATAAAPAALTGVLMSSKATLAVATVAVAISFFAGWALKSAIVPDSETRAERTDDRTVPADRFAALERQLDTERRQRELLKTELDQIQRESYAAQKATEGEEGEVRVTGPRFVYAGAVEALNDLDWDKIGSSMSRMPEKLAALTQALDEGKPLEDLADEIAELGELNSGLVGEALKMSKSGLSGTGLNGIFTNPAVMVNMVHAALKKADLPLTEQQERLLYEIGLRYTEEDRRRTAGYGDDVFRMEKLAEEGALKQRFFNEVYGLLDTDQGERLRPDVVRGRSKDLFSVGVMYAPLARPVPFKDRASLEHDIVERAMNKLQLDDASRSAVEAAVRRWSQALPPEFLDVPPPRNPRVPIQDTAHVQAAAEHQAALMRELATRLSLTEEQRKGLAGEVGVLVPYRQPAQE